ncbi:MAG: hypothetical protein Q9187_008925 [Circinaria calcarea]
MSNLASAYYHQGRLKEAEELRVQEIEMRKIVHGPEHQSSLSAMNQLIVIYMAQGRWPEAEQLVMKIDLKAISREDPLTLCNMHNLVGQGRWKAAEELGIQVVELKKKVLGTEHRNTLISMGELAELYWRQGRLKEAEEL